MHSAPLLVLIFFCAGYTARIAHAPIVPRWTRRPERGLRHRAQGKSRYCYIFLANVEEAMAAVVVACCGMTVIFLHR